MVSTFLNMYFIRIYYNYRKPDRAHKATLVSLFFYIKYLIAEYEM